MVCSMVSLKHWLHFIYSAWLCVFDTLCIAVEVVVCIGVCMLFLMWYGGSVVAWPLKVNCYVQGQLVRFFYRMSSAVIKLCRVVKSFVTDKDPINHQSSIWHVSTMQGVANI